MSDEITHDRVFAGAAVVAQRRSGYRYTGDALWLVMHSVPLAQGRVVDLGAGSGVVGLSLAAVTTVHTVSLVEVQPGLAALARQSVQLTEPRCRVNVVEADLRHLVRRNVGGAADLVVANPPFFNSKDTRPAQDAERDRARRALAGDLVDFARAAARLLRGGGYLTVVYPARDLHLVCAALDSSGLGLRVVRPVQTTPAEPARLVLATARKGARSDVELLAPWQERDAQGRESDSAKRLRTRTILTPTLD